MYTIRKERKFSLNYDFYIKYSATLKWEDTDEKRFNLIRAFLEKRPLNIDYLFDATINRSSFSIEIIADLIVTMFEKKASVKKAKLNLLL